MTTRNYKPTLEPLEPRTLYSAVPVPVAVTVVETNAVINVTGTRGADDIHLSLNVADSNLVDVLSAGVVVHTFDKSLVAGINIKGGAGNDRITCDAGLGLALELAVDLDGG